MPLFEHAYRPRVEFSSTDDYAMYVRDEIRVGMMVRCCRSYEEVHSGDIGTVVKVDRGALHNLNVQVDWQRKRGTYWVRYIHIELLDQSGYLQIVGVFRVGDKVRVKPSITTPTYKWGSVSHRSVGVVTQVDPNGRDLLVDFPEQQSWHCLTTEMEQPPTTHPGVTCSECGVTPLCGARFKCKVCDQFNYCEDCYFTKRTHRHLFNRIAEPGSAAVYAGPAGRGRARRPLAVAGNNTTAISSFSDPTPSVSHSAGILTDWSACVAHISVSSRENLAYRLTDGTSSFWQSCGDEGKHWIRLEIQSNVCVESLRMLVDPSDNSYMPSSITIKGGSSVHKARILNSVNVQPNDTWVQLLSRVTEAYRFIEIGITSCKSGGIDCRVHLLSITGKLLDPLADPWVSHAFLATDEEEQQVS